MCIRRPISHRSGKSHTLDGEDDLIIDRHKTQRQRHPQDVVSYTNH